MHEEHEIEPWVRTAFISSVEIIHPGINNPHTDPKDHVSTHAIQ